MTIVAIDQLTGLDDLHFSLILCLLWFSHIMSNCYCTICAEMKDTPDAPKQAKKELEKLGPLSLDEKITAGAFAVTVGLWIFGGAIGINAVAAALLGLSILLITNVVKWKDCLGK